MIGRRAERVENIDILRGLALLGIFFVNLPTMESSIHTFAQTNFETGLRFFYDLFIQTKFYTIFSFLFGVSAYYFMRSQERKGLAYKRLFFIRVAWLFVFGVIHTIFIWYGDILHNYALIGFALPLLYKQSPKRIILLAGILFAISFSVTQLPSIVAEYSSAPPQVTEDAKPVQMAEATDDIASNGESAYPVAIGSNMSYSAKVKQYTGILMHSFGYFNLEILSLALLGLGVAKANFFEDFARYKRITKRIAIIAFLLSLPIIALMVRDFWNGIPLANLTYVWLSGKLLAVVYTAILLFACENIRIRERLGFLSSYGKMAFTNYLAQSLITVFIIIPIISDFTLSIQLVYGVIVLSLQVFVSTVIMKKHRYGPFEYVWRRLVFLGK